VLVRIPKRYLLLAIPLLAVAALTLPIRKYAVPHGVSVGVSRILRRPPAAPLKVAGPAVVVDKSEHKLYLYDGGRLVRSYQVAFGFAEESKDKQVEGDGATPAGRFYITEKSVLTKATFLGTRWMRLSYPNLEDAARGLSAGLLSRDEHDRIRRAIERGETPPQRTKLGGGIGIHGGGFSVLGRPVLDWTAGCVALTDGEVEELYASVKVGTPVVIRY